MATIIKRRDGRFELRESRWTADGPRSRTLAVFRELTPETLDKAEARAERSFDRAAVLERAEEIGVHMRRVFGTAEPSALVARLQSGALWPTQIRALQQSLEDLPSPQLPDHLEAMIQWMGADDTVRGRALADLLGLAHAIMRHREPSRTEALAFPSLAHCG